MSIDSSLPAVLGFTGSAGGESQVVRDAWSATIATLATWPADQPVRPVLERRIGRITRSGPLTETVILGLHDPLGVLDEAAAMMELSALARPLLAANALRALAPAATRRLLAAVPAHLQELRTVSPLMPEGVRAMAPLMRALDAGLTALRGPVSLSFTVTPNDAVTSDLDPETGDDAVRTVLFRTRLSSAQPTPIALRSQAEALCLSERPVLSPWCCPTDGQVRTVLRHSVERLQLHHWEDGIDPGVRPLVAAAMLSLPGPRAEVAGRSYAGPLPAQGTKVARVLLPNGRRGVWRQPWDDRRRHTFIAGSTGSGKSTLMLRHAADDVREGRSIFLVDPHGDLANQLATLVPKDRLVLIDPRRQDTFPLDLLDPDPDRASAHLASAAAEVWPQEWLGPVWLDAMTLATRVLAATRRSEPVSLADVARFFHDAAWRDARIERVRSASLKAEAQRSSASWSRPSNEVPAASWLAGKLAPLVRGPGSELFREGALATFEDLIGARKVVVVVLPLGVLGTENLRLIGRMLLSRLTTAIAAQGAVAEQERVPVSVFVDEAHAVAGDALGGLFAQARKFNTAVTVATQSPSQLGAQLGKVLTNAETMLLGRLPLAESQVLLDRIGRPTAEVLAALPRFHAVAIDERHSRTDRPVILQPLARPAASPLPLRPAEQAESHAIA